ncbi:Aristolochene synthase in complex with 12,13 Difluorofarnesyl diphosphate [Lophium mytilinum]|uniref:Terpene synthase n=1 Tax=Lophium mytilinum TaxID=390894 RepID=A0A6A6QK13_9PEZI|nr:Aristolochene synthase in complex with 12,13 Difluorofarnesyl diphosphate [Lophium mytilinum]
MTAVQDPSILNTDTATDLYPSLFTSVCHPNVNEAVRDVDGWFLDNWKFPDQKSRKKFVAAGFSRVTCLYFPKALESRIRSACKLLTILFLVDDQLEYMSLQDGKDYNESLMPFCTGNVQPNQDDPVQWMMYEIWEEMRALDRQLAEDVVQPVFLFMRAQTSKERLSITRLHQYFQYRQGDVGQALLAALMRFSYDLHLSRMEVDFVADIEKNCGKHISLVNDIYSYEKEKLISEQETSEGAILCNAVQILADQVQVSIEVSKNLLWVMVREYEFVHRDLVDGKNALFPGLVLKGDLRHYVDGLQYQMSGNELWSKTTNRYRQAAADLKTQKKGLLLTYYASSMLVKPADAIAETKKQDPL